MATPSADQFALWAHGLRRSDKAAFAELYHQTYDSLHRFVWFMTRNADATADVLQELYLKLWLVRASIDPARSLRALLYQMARNFALNHLRSLKRHMHESLADVPFEPAAPATADEALDHAVLATHLQGWIDALPPRRREAFCLSRFEGLSHDEIAEVMALAPKTVNNHIVLALQSLREHLYTHDSDASF